MLGVEGLSVEIGGRTIVSGETFLVRARDKVGLVGRNGAGKTTLLKVLGGGSRPIAGKVTRTGGLGYLSQDPRADAVPDDTRALAHVLSGRGLADAEQRLEKLRLSVEEDPSTENIRRFTRAQERFEADGGYAADAEVRAIAAGLGLADDRLDLTIGVLSGGERRRLELARILFAGSDVLLLDEPTNHLDVDAKAWLVKFLRGYRGALLVISHDLDLLDEAITRILHLEREAEEATGRLVEYKGTYSQYVVARAADEERRTRVAARQSAEIDRLERQADSMRGSSATRARKAKVLDHRAARLQRDAIEGPARSRAINVRFPAPPHAGRTVLEVSDLAKGYGAVDVFEDVTFSVGRGERLLVLGLNGAGKTTLLRALAGVTEPDLGEVRWGLHVSTGYYAQEHEGIHGGRSLLDHMKDHGGAVSARDQRALLGMFGLSGEKAHQDAGTLSGGEKTKLALAQLVAGRHNVLLLDEPTNNLDPGSRTAVGAALAGWPGTMLVVSHDTEFVRELRPDRVLLMPEATLDFWSDELEDLVAMA